jgi:hypothetical protein
MNPLLAATASCLILFFLMAESQGVGTRPSTAGVFQRIVADAIGPVCNDCSHYETATVVKFGDSDRPSLAGI